VTTFDTDMTTTDYRRESPNSVRKWNVHYVKKKYSFCY